MITRELLWLDGHEGGVITRELLGLDGHEGGVITRELLGLDGHEGGGGADGAEEQAEEEERACWEM